MDSWIGVVDICTEIYCTSTEQAWAWARRSRCIKQSQTSILPHLIGIAKMCNGLQKVTYDLSMHVDL